MYFLNFSELKSKIVIIDALGMLEVDSQCFKNMVTNCAAAAPYTG